MSERKAKTIYDIKSIDMSFNVKQQLKSTVTMPSQNIIK